MGVYREKRNYEMSTVDFIKTNIIDDWSNVNVYRSWGEVSGNNLPAVCVRSGINIHNRVGVGSFATMRQVTLLIDIFATSEGQGLDLTDYLTHLLKKSWTYNEYTVVSGVSTLSANGKIVCQTIEDSPVNLNINKSELDKIDRYRYLISIQCATNNAEI